MKTLLFEVALLFSLYAPERVSCFPDGGPSAACDNLTPSASAHGAPQQDSTFPYRLDFSELCYNNILTYTPGQTYTLTLMGRNGEQFRGFLIQSRLVADDSRVGTFAVASGSTDTQLSACPIPADGITHTNNNDKNYINFSWTAPPAGTGQIQFGLAVVQTQPVHWANVRSMMIGEGGVNATNDGAECTVTVPATTVSIAMPATMVTVAMPATMVMPGTTARATQMTDAVVNNCIITSSVAAIICSLVFFFGGAFAGSLIGHLLTMKQLQGKRTDNDQFVAPLYEELSDRATNQITSHNIKLAMKSTDETKPAVESGVSQMVLETNEAYEVAQMEMETNEAYALEVDQMELETNEAYRLPEVAQIEMETNTAYGHAIL